MTKFDHFWPFWGSKNFSTKKIFNGHLGHMETQLYAKNKNQYDWFPGKSQNSKKFSAKFKPNPTRSNNHRVFLNIMGG